MGSRALTPWPEACVALGSPTGPSQEQRAAVISFIGDALRDVRRDTFSHGIYRTRKDKRRMSQAQESVQIPPSLELHCCPCLPPGHLGPGWWEGVAGKCERAQGQMVFRNRLFKAVNERPILH